MAGFVQGGYAYGYTSGNYTVTLPNAPTAGNLLIAAVSVGNDRNLTNPPGWTRHRDRLSTWGEGNPTNTFTLIYYKVSDGTETKTLFSHSTSGRSNVIVAEFDVKNATLISTIARHSTTPTSNTVGPTPQVASPGDFAVAIAQTSDGLPAGYTVGSGYTGVVISPQTGIEIGEPNEGPWGAFQYTEVTSAGAVSANMGIATGYSTFDLLVFREGEVEPDPPSGEIVIYDGVATQGAEGVPTSKSLPPLTLTAGRSILVSVHWGDGLQGDHFGSVTDSLGNTYQEIPYTRTHEYIDTRWVLGYVEYPGEAIITANFTRATPGPEMSAREISGLDLEDPVVGIWASGQNSGGTSQPSATATITDSGQHLIVVGNTLYSFQGQPNQYAWTNDFTPFESGNVQGMTGVAYRIVDEPGNYSTTATTANTTGWVSVIMALRAGAGAPDPDPEVVVVTGNGSVGVTSTGTVEAIEGGVVPVGLFIQGSATPPEWLAPSVTVNLQSAPTAGNLLIATFSAYDVWEPTSPGWTSHRDPKMYSANYGYVNTYYKVSDGTETGITFNIVGTPPGERMCTVGIAEYNIQNATLIDYAISHRENSTSFPSGPTTELSNVGDLVVSIGGGRLDHDTEVWTGDPNYIQRLLSPYTVYPSRPAYGNAIAFQDKIATIAQQESSSFTAPQGSYAVAETLIFRAGGEPDPGIIEVTGTGSLSVVGTGSLVSVSPGTYTLDITTLPTLDPPIGAALRLISTTTADACWVYVSRSINNTLYITDAQQPGDVTLSDLAALEVLVEIRRHS